MVNASLKQKLARGELVVGTLMTFDFWAGYLEIYKQVGMDFVFLDMEHGVRRSGQSRRTVPHCPACWTCP